MPNKVGPCICCGKAGKYTVILARAPHGSPNLKHKRYYIPNQTVRDDLAERGEHSVASETWFCHPCMRKVEDNMRATIMYLQAENGLLATKPLKKK